MDLRTFHGTIKKCETCTNPAQPMDCKRCFCRGYLSVCLNCSGTGQTTTKVAGTDMGNMRSTCDKCGGTGTFPANKPEEIAAEPDLEVSSSESALGSLSMANDLISDGDLDEDDDEDEDVDVTRAVYNPAASIATHAISRPESISKRVWKRMTFEQQLHAIPEPVGETIATT